MTARAHSYRWESYSDKRLLDLRFCDLRLSLKHAAFAPRIDKLHGELAARGLQFRPHVWLADEWFSPDGVPGFAIPFYLAHPRLARLERKMMQEVEGGNFNWLMRILRHETGHAIDSAYRIRRRKDWRDVFGKASTPYPKSYRPLPTSKKHVLHLGHWYAQTHPTEDFAETFAVWLQPRARWRREYADWAALAKLEYIDALMRELQGQPVKVRSREVIEPLSENTMTLREFYRREAVRYAIEVSTVYDEDLLSVFTSRRASKNTNAIAQLRRLRPAITHRMARDMGVHAYLVHNVMRMIIERGRDLDLASRGPGGRRAVFAMVERITFDMLYRRRQQYVL